MDGAKQFSFYLLTFIQNGHKIIPFYKIAFHHMKQIPEKSRPNYSVQVLQRGMDLMDAILEAGQPLKLEQLSALTHLPKSTVFRILSNLVKGEYLVETSQGFWAGLKLLRFGVLVESSLDVKHQAEPYLLQLRDQLNETVHLAVLDNEHRVVYLEKLATQHAVGLMQSRVGNTSPMHCTGVGKILAAYLPESEIRAWLAANDLKAYTPQTIVDAECFLQDLRASCQRGYAIDQAEHEAGVTCIAAPIFDWNGRVIAAISVAGPEQRMPMPLLNSTMAAEVVNTAQKISTALGFIRPTAASTIIPT